MNKLIIVSALGLGLAGCGAQVTNLALETEVTNLCTAGAQAYAKLDHPTKLQVGAKRVLDGACRNPAATSDLILAVYRVIVPNKG